MLVNGCQGRRLEAVQRNFRAASAITQPVPDECKYRSFVPSRSTNSPSSKDILPSPPFPRFPPRSRLVATCIFFHEFLAFEFLERAKKRSSRSFDRFSPIIFLNQRGSSARFKLELNCGFRCHRAGKVGASN